MSENFATRVYVVGEVAISLVVLVGGFVLVYAGPDPGVRLVGSGLLSAVTVFWFQRRATESSNNQISQLADTRLSQVLEDQHAQSSKLDATIALVAQSAARASRAEDVAAAGPISARLARDATAGGTPTA